jgi:hypothetical protein
MTAAGQVEIAIVPGPPYRHPAQPGDSGVLCSGLAKSAPALLTIWDKSAK